MTWRMSTFILCIFLSVLCGAQQVEKTPFDAPKVIMADLAFISGHNFAEMNGGLADEYWSAPNGDSMMGMFRFVKDGKVEMYEFLTIERTESGPVLRLRHFNPGLIGWEDKDKAYNYPLIALSSNEAVFERPDKATSLTFRKVAEDKLEVTLIRTGRDPEVFKFKHVPPQ